MAAHELDPDDSTMLLLEALESTRQTNKQTLLFGAFYKIPFGGFITNVKEICRAFTV